MLLPQNQKLIADDSICAPENAIDSEMEKKRLMLLKTLEDRRRYDYDDISGDERRQLEAEYNSIVDLQLERTKGPLPDPLDALPSELWINIFQRFAYSSSSSKPMNNTLRLTLVSTKWRDAIIRTPELWSKITIGSAVEETDVIITTALYFSGVSPLTLLIEHPNRDWDLVLPLLLPHKSRIRSIVTQKPNFKLFINDHRPIISVASMISSFGRLPALRHLDVRTAHSLGKAKSEIFPENTPSIRSVRGTYIPSSILHHENLKFICGFVCEASLDVVIPYLFHLPYLRHLHLSARRKPSTAENITFRYALPSQWPSLPLQSFAFQQCYHELLLPLISSSPNISALKITIQWEQLAEILSGLPSLFFLESLVIHITGTTDYKVAKFTEDDSLQCIKAKELDLTFDQDPNGSRQDLENCRCLFIFLEKCGKGVQKLSINELESVELAVGYIASLPGLRDLRLSIKHPRFHVVLPPLHLGSLEVLQLGLKSSTTAGFLGTLQAPKLSKLKLYCDKTPVVASRIELRLDNVVYSNLRTIRWGSEILAWQFASLRSLTSVSFKDTSATTATDFCVYILYRPNEFPSLQDIIFVNQPEWDCVMLMLERRNFLPDSSISRIKSLSFPSRTSLFLRRPIANLLRGCFTPRPSNYEISLEGIKEIYFDKTIPGCHHCTLALQPCQSEIINQRPPRELFERKCSEYLNTITPDPPLSDEVALWLEERQMRYALWLCGELTWRYCSRIHSCDPNQHSYTYVVTGLVMHGLNIESVDV